MAGPKVSIIKRFHCSSKLPDSFQWFPHKMAAFYTEQCTSPLLFLNFEVSLGTLNQSLKNYGFIFDTIFFTCTHVAQII